MIGKKTTTLLLILTIMIIAGCSAGQSEQRTVAPTHTEKTPEQVLAKEVADGKLVEVYDEFVRVSEGGVADNWMVIRNARDKTEEFTIYPCEGCEFEDEKVSIPSGEYKIIKFNVLADEGQKDIRVKDSLRNAYGYARISVIIE